MSSNISPKLRAFSSFRVTERQQITTPLRHRSSGTAKTKSIRGSFWTRPRYGSSAASSPVAALHGVETISRNPPAVAYWLFAIGGLTFGIVVIGGLTRLTESGLSITEWKPLTGAWPPVGEEAWAVEFDKYKQTPEYRLLNHTISLSEFKIIYFMEWAHRQWGRLIGVAFVLPATYFIAKRRVTPKVAAGLVGIAGMIGFQGLIGWWMVKSGLREELMVEKGAVPRVSQYRLAAHLGTAFLVYSSMVWLGADILRSNKAARDGRLGGESLALTLSKLNGPIRNFRGAAFIFTGLVFLTALSGAFVAGLDAGLMYNEFPYMGEKMIPPTEDLFADSYAVRDDKSDKIWRNLLENPTTVQFDHRVLAMTTFTSVTGLFLWSRTKAMKALLPVSTVRLVGLAFAFACTQVTLGISTLIYLVPVPLAAAHQAGSLALLTSMLTVCASLKRPGLLSQLQRSVQGQSIKSMSNVKNDTKGVSRLITR